MPGREGGAAFDRSARPVPLVGPRGACERVIARRARLEVIDEIDIVPARASIDHDLREGPEIALDKVRAIGEMMSGCAGILEEAKRAAIIPDKVIPDDQEIRPTVDDQLPM